jgi:hypothetical protein
MPTAKLKKTADPTKAILWGVITLLVITCCGLLFAVYNQIGVKFAPSISLGVLQYEFSGDKPTLRTDAATVDLRKFLNHEAATSGCPTTMPAYEHIVAHSHSEDQILLHYGCGGADSPMFAIKTADGWKALSPTNQFNDFGVPACSYLTDNIISKEIAPVCVDSLTATTPKYTIR